MNEMRWQQRFQNFSKAFHQLSDAIKRDSSDKVIQGGIIQFFEFTFELAWKTMKDKLEFEGLTSKTPRETIKNAFQAQYISDGQIWLEALDNRNLLSHTYDEDIANEVIDLILNKYYPAIKELHELLKNEIRSN